MNIKSKIKRDIDRLLPMACDDIITASENVDFAAFSDRRRADRDTPAGYYVADGVANIAINGLLVPKMGYDCSDHGITGYNHINEYLEEANIDPAVESIALNIDSSGGYVIGLHTVADNVKASAKPVHAYCDGLAQSAAYWIAAAASTITATEGSIIGSVGILATHMEESAALTMRGIKATVIGSGIWKSAFSPLLPLTDEQVTRIRENVDADAQIFFEHVASCRSLSVATVRGWQADSFTATEAKNHGMIDNIGGQPTTIMNRPNAAKGDDMDLITALAEIETLKKDALAKDTALTSANSTIDNLRTEKRESDITALAASVGREFTVEEKNSFKAMDDAAFAFASSFTASLTTAAVPTAPTAPTAPAFPSALFGQQANTGHTPLPVGGGIDAAFAQAKLNNTKA